MTYLGTISEQVTLFFKTCGFGFLLGALYEVFRVLRRLLTGGRFILLWDLLYSITASVTGFLFLLSYGNGKLRLYIVIGMIIGFSVYYLTLGTSVSRCVDAAIGIVMQIIKVISKPFISILNYIRTLFVCFGRRFKIFLKKVKKKFNFHLKSTGILLYNSKR
ncbi:MAG: spore cortex biosynthesis protein YabQ [Clostridia bacterium]|nr:spore cortex biosynthesis protein YabQ [Clostridia bacterium]